LPLGGGSPFNEIILEDSMWIPLLIFMLVAYASFATLFTPVIFFVVNKGSVVVYQEYGMVTRAVDEKYSILEIVLFSFHNIFCVILANIVICSVAVSSKAPFLVPCVLFGEAALLLALTIVIRKQHDCYVAGFSQFLFPVFEPRLKTHFLQPFFFAFKTDVLVVLVKLIAIPVMLLVSTSALCQSLRNPVVVPVDAAVGKEDCAVILPMPTYRLDIKAISNNDVRYANGPKKSWNFTNFNRGDGLYVPEGEYSILGDFSIHEDRTEYSFSGYELKINLKKGRVYYLKTEVDANKEYGWLVLEEKQEE
jgi:hypothetical protein